MRVRILDPRHFPQRDTVAPTPTQQSRSLTPRSISQGSLSKDSGWRDLLIQTSQVFQKLFGLGQLRKKLFFFPERRGMN